MKQKQNVRHQVILKNSKHGCFFYDGTDQQCFQNKKQYENENEMKKIFFYTIIVMRE